MNGLQISVCGVHELPEYVERRITHVVSIWNGCETENEERRWLVGGYFPDAHKHFAFFDDHISDQPARFAPGMETVRSILEFTTALDSNARLLVHCAMGISRSTAIALATLCHRAGPGYETECFAALRRIRPSACPNPRIIHFADSILGRNGALIASIKNCVETAAI